MILQFIRRDPAWKYTPWLTAGAAALAALNAFYHQTWLPIVLTAPIYLVLCTRTMPHQRATFFEAALPVSARHLFLARALALLSMIWLPALAGTAVLLLTGAAAENAPKVVVAALALSLALVVNLSVRIREFSAPVWLTMACPAFAAAAIAPTLSLGNPAAAAAILAAAATAVGVWAWTSVPDAFQFATLRVASPRTVSHTGAPSVPWWPVIRSLFPWQTAIFVPVSLIWASTGEWIFAPMYLMMAYSQIRLNTRWALALPISRRALLAASIAPLLLVLLGGAEFGMLTGIVKEAKNIVRLGDPDNFRGTGAIDVFVNRAFWEKAPDGQVPAIRAPWGETSQPPPLHILGMTFYNPYYVAQRNSFGFQDWQFARATTHIYGRPIAARDLAKTVAAGARPITVSPRMQILTLAAIAANGLFWVWMIELFSWRRIGLLSTKVRTVVTTTLALTPILLTFGVDLAVGNSPGSLSQPAFEAALLWASRHLPGNLAAVGLAVLLPLAIIWWITERQSAAAEITGPLKPPQTIFDRVR